jgi:hypothetical protein
MSWVPDSPYDNFQVLRLTGIGLVVRQATFQAGQIWNDLGLDGTSKGKVIPRMILLGHEKCDGGSRAHLGGPIWGPIW